MSLWKKRSALSSLQLQQMSCRMIKCDRVTLSFQGNTLFENVSFTLQKGERCGLIGRNGSGKSTLFRLLSGEMEPDAGDITIPKGYRIGYLKQHILFSEESLIKEAALALAPHQKDQLYKAEKILFGLGFTEKDLDLSPHSFSGGYHLRLHLAKVLIEEPDCLLLDEPTNYLDILSIRWLTQFLNRWSGEFILISHDREFMDGVTTHTMGIHRKKMRKMKGSSLDLFQQILIEEEVHEKTRAKLEKKREKVQSFIDRFGAKATKAKQAQSKKKMLDREPVLEKLNQLSELSFSFHEAPFTGKKLLEVKGLEFSFTQAPLIHDFSLEIEKQERIAIIGKNGRGKSTLLRLLGKDLQSSKGVVKFSDNAHLGYFGQTHVDRLNPHHTIEEEISAANPLLSYTEIKAIAGAMLFGKELSEKKISILSGGEKSRVLLGKIISKPCNLLLLDEPTHHLDIESIESLIDALEDFSGSLVIVTHSELILKRLNLNKIILCNPAEQLLFVGDYEEFLEKIGWEEEKRVAAPKKNQSTLRKERAEWIVKRSQVLKPLEKKIQECEKKLISLEELQKMSQKSLELGDNSPILLKDMGIRQKQIDEIEKELYVLYELFEEKKKEFE